ncbi:hypothetical protein GGS23DRAFT_226721 [Durotheca rogersii]|uniref:uncharacterized protein n=1 Tax=Durotheca rogersii TaxID=419775 RepID=UPI0022207CEC|nr:uncharacterized protein GGS23DRAFT_226721 [Durotheca rogersii]KAI5860506.1 hypothetical protein GGS23DRAFT_226721 [Durotheca rogersii]
MRGIPLRHSAFAFLMIWFKNFGSSKGGRRSPIAGRFVDTERFPSRKKTILARLLDSCLLPFPYPHRSRCGRGSEWEEGIAYLGWRKGVKIDGKRGGGVAPEVSVRRKRTAQHIRPPRGKAHSHLAGTTALHLLSVP